MTTHNHTDIEFNADADSVVVNAPLGQLDAAIGNLALINTAPKTSVADAIGTAAPTTVAKTLSGSLNELDADVGNLATLGTTPKTSVVAAIGPSVPTTAAKTLSGAINELDANVGDLATISTPEPSSIAAALGNLLAIGVNNRGNFSEAIGHTQLRTPTRNSAIAGINNVYDLVVAAQAEVDALEIAVGNLVVAGGNIATKTNGVSAAGQKVITVDSTTGFIVGSYVVYLLNGTALEGNVIASIQDGVSLTMETNIGATPAGGVLDDTYISMISISEYMAAQAIPHAGTLLLPDTIEYVNQGAFHAAAYGMSTSGSAADNAAALQAAIDAAAVLGGTVKLPPGNYALTTVSLSSGVTLEGAGFGSDPDDQQVFGTILTISGANYGIQIGAKAHEAYINVRNLSIVGTATGKAGIRLGYHQADPGHYVGSVIIENVWIEGFTGAAVSHDVSTGEPAATGAAGVFVPRGITCALRNVRCANNYYGLYESSDHQSTTLICDGCSFRENTKYGVRLSDFTHYTFRDCLFEANGDSGFAVLPSDDTAGAPSGLTMNQCYWEANGASAGSGTELYQMYIDCLNSGHSLSGLRMDACSFQPGDTGADNAAYLDEVRHAFLTYNSFGNNTGSIFTVAADCEAILIIGGSTDSTSGWIGNSLAAKAVELAMSDATLTMNAGTLRLDTSTANAPLIIRQESDTNEQEFITVLRNTTNNVLRLTSDANGDAELTMYADGGSGATYIKTGAADDATFPSKTRVASLGVGNSVAATTLGSVAKKIQIYDGDGNSLGYIPVYDNIT